MNRDERVPAPTLRSVAVLSALLTRPPANTHEFAIDTRQEGPPTNDSGLAPTRDSAL